MNEARRSFMKKSAIAGGALLAGSRSTAATQETRKSPGERFRALLDGPDVLHCPVIFDGSSAKLSAQIGFPAVFAGGQTVSASMFAAGDFGTLTMTELIEFSGRIAEAVNIPVVADADDGGGNPLNVHRTIRRFERVGVASVMIEDMYGAKHLPGLNEGSMTPIPAFVDKIKAAVDARRDGLVLIARSDALSAGEPFERGLERLTAYAEAGADAVFLAGAGIRQSPAIAEATKSHVMTVTMPTDPDASPDIVRESRVKLACYAYQVMAVALGAVEKALTEIKNHGRIENFAERAISRESYQRLTDAALSVDVARRFNATGD